MWKFLRNTNKVNSYYVSVEYNFLKLKIKIKGKNFKLQILKLQITNIFTI